MPVPFSAPLEGVLATRTSVSTASARLRATMRWHNRVFVPAARCRNRRSEVGDCTAELSRTDPCRPGLGREQRQWRHGRRHRHRRRLEPSDLAGRLVAGRDCCQQRRHRRTTSGTERWWPASSHDRNNYRGVAGIAPLANIMPIKVLGGDGSGGRHRHRAGIDWAVRRRRRHQHVARQSVTDVVLQQAVAGAITPASLSSPPRTRRGNG